MGPVAHGAEPLFAGPKTLDLLGDTPATHVAAFRFRDRNAVQAWFDSPEYQALTDLRDQAMTSSFAIVGP